MVFEIFLDLFWVIWNTGLSGTLIYCLVVKAIGGGGGTPKNSAKGIQQPFKLGYTNPLNERITKHNDIIVKELTDIKPGRPWHAYFEKLRNVY